MAIINSPSTRYIHLERDGCLCVVISHTATQNSLVSHEPTLVSAAPHKSFTGSWNYRADFINHFKGSRTNPLPSQTFVPPGSLTMPDWMNKGKLLLRDGNSRSIWKIGNEFAQK